MNALGSKSDAAPGLRARLYLRLLGWLNHPHADRVIWLLAVVSLLPSLDTGLAADDYLHTVMLDRPSPMPGFARAPLDIFRFCDARFFPQLLAEGVFSWWDDPHTRLAFMRPISAATHVFDHAFFRNSSAFMHLHSALWAALLYLGVRALYRKLTPDRALANLAFALYALDDARGWLVSWVAARNAAIATAFSVWALYVHILARSGRRQSGPSRAALSVLSALLFCCALLSGEGSVAICGYLLAYELFLAEGTLSQRLLGLWPYGCVLVVWRVAYRMLGFGAYGSSLYVDPLSEPLAFLSMLLRNGPVLLAAQFGFVWSDVWSFAFAAPRLYGVLYALTCAFLLWVLWVTRVLYRTTPLMRFALLASLLAVPAASTTFPRDQLLTWIAIGASLALAQLFLPLLRAQAEQSVMQQRGIALLLAVHLISMPLLASRARGNLVFRDFLGRSDSGIPRDPSVRDKTLIYVNPPLLPFAAYPPIERAAQGIPRPHQQHILAIGTTPLLLERVDANTLRLSPRDGFLLDPVSKLMWSERRPFTVGEQIVQTDMTVTILAITPDRRPLRVEMHFARALEDPSYVWCSWHGTRSGPFTPPPIGSSTLVPGADYLETTVAAKLPFELRL
jgi:hypothetical protein